MTTIAYRNGVLAGDGRETCQNDDQSSFTILDDKSRKVFKLKNGCLFGGAHGSEDILRLQHALVKGKKPPPLDDVAGLLIDPDGRIWLYEGHIWQRVRKKYYAIGSGSLFAFAAMDAGADALLATKIGANRDPYSGGKIRSVRL